MTNGSFSYPPLCPQTASISLSAGRWPCSSFIEKAEAGRRTHSEQPAHAGSAALVQNLALQVNTWSPPHWPPPKDHPHSPPQSCSLASSMFPSWLSRALTPYCLYWPLLFSFSMDIKTQGGINTFPGLGSPRSCPFSVPPAHHHKSPREKNPVDRQSLGPKFLGLCQHLINMDSLSVL